VSEIPLGVASMPPWPGSAPRTGDEILVAYAEPSRQNRLTVLVRVLLAIPHLITLIVLGLIGFFVLVISWFAALIMGRLPGGFARYLAGLLRWSARVYAYLFLLTDEYPPFELADSDYPVRVSLAPGRLNRLAVLFRIILIIPAGIVLNALLSGLFVALVVVWLIVLIMGRMPVTLYRSVAVAHRAWARYTGYSYLLTATYPWGMFGDKRAADAQPASTPPPGEPGAGAYPAPGTPGAGYAQPGAEGGWVSPADPGQQGYGEPGSGQPGYGQPGDAATPAAGPAAPSARPWQLARTDGMVALVWLFIALGVVASGFNSYRTSQVINGNGPATQTAIAKISAAHRTLSKQIHVLEEKTVGCQSDPQPLPCVTKVDQQASQAFGTFAATVQGTQMPSDATEPAKELHSDSVHAQHIFGQLAQSSSLSQYQQTFSSSGLQDVLNKFNQDYQSLGHALGAT
jgi:Domain of unknown function (DUF4389)